MGQEVWNLHVSGNLPMKALFIITRTNEMHKHFESFKCLDPANDVKLYTYNHVMEQPDWPSGAKLDEEIYNSAKDYKPDLIVYVGAANGNTPTAVGFNRLRREIAPTVHFCSDAADEPWWKFLQEFDEEKSFTAQVALDGNKNWPLAHKEITALTPLDPSHFPNPPIPHKNRPTVFGFAGNPGSVSKLKDGRVVGRRPLVAQMIQFGLQHRARTRCRGDIDSSVSSYKEAATYMANTRIMPNFAQTGSFERMHVKGRVVEAGWAGCLLLEPKGSPTPDWFEPGVDYLQYDDMEQAKGFVDKYRNDHEGSQAFGLRLRAKVEAEHSPQKFWGRIFARL